MPSEWHSRKLAQGISLPPFPSVGQTGPQAAGMHAMNSASLKANIIISLACAHGSFQL
jgi:hypothetical protein